MKRFDDTLQGRPAPETPSVGEKVRIISGRHAGSTGELEALGDVATPGGSTVQIAVVIRPRAGRTYTFGHEIERDG